MSETRIPKPPADIVVTHPIDDRKIVAEQMAQSHQVLAECWRIQHNTGVGLQMQLETLKVAMQLMKINLKQYQALSGRAKEFTHRIIVQRGGDTAAGEAMHDAPLDVTPQSAPPPPTKILETIHGGGPRIRTP